MADAIQFERDALFDEVWTDPISTVSKRYGLSDNGLRKICKKLSVPFPPLGYWARLRAGHKVRRTPLPRHDGPTTLRAQPEQHTYRVAETDVESGNREAIQRDEDRPERRISPNKSGEWRHRLVRALAKRLADVDKQIEVESRPHKSDAGRPRFDRIAPHVTKPGGLLDMGAEFAAIIVTPTARQRALSIADAFLLAMEARGFKVRLEDGHTLISCKDVVMQFRMSEMAEKVGEGVGSKTWRALGRLRITLRQHGYDSFGPPDMRARDEADVSLEDQLNDLAGRLRRAVLGYEERELGRNAEAKRVQNEAILRHQLAWHEQMASEAAHREKAAIETMFAEAALSAACESRLRYLARVETAASARGMDVSDESSIGLWLAWARAACASLDPLLSRVNGFTRE